ncbi:MAG TPA: LacI family DNA-binding transcriptional regulator [Candidatus Eisenbacteria bacterium]|nr:LacI family DNA-binding transcriptional regulator [Candidatus Eisenbacteria bacterium]
MAREAGVSIATISRVFNQSARVSEETRHRVRDTAARLGYWPNGAARSLITRRTHALGALLPELHGEFFSEVIRGMDLAARRHGFHLIVSSSHADAAELLAALRSMRGRVDGLIAMTPDPGTPAAMDAFAPGLPMVLLNPGSPVRHADTLAIANVEGARAMVRHLARLGHRRIAFVCGPAHNIDAAQRLRGYRQALRAAGLEPRETPGAFTEASGYEAAKELLRAAPRPDAIFAANDAMATGVLGALREAGVRVPDDVAVAGFDDIVSAAWLDPPLTTVRVEPSRLGDLAVERLLEAIAAPADLRRRHEVVATTLVVRRSCGAAARAGATDGVGAPAGATADGNRSAHDGRIHPRRRAAPRTEVRS